jgi:hypothetical protein
MGVVSGNKQIEKKQKAVRVCCKKRKINKSKKKEKKEKKIVVALGGVIGHKRIGKGLQCR